MQANFLPSVCVGIAFQLTYIVYSGSWDVIIIIIILVVVISLLSPCCSTSVTETEVLNQATPGLTLNHGTHDLNGVKGHLSNGISKR